MSNPSKIFLVFESDLSGLGNIFSANTSPDLAYQAACRMLDTLLLFDSFTNKKNPLDSHELEMVLKEKKSITVYSEAGVATTIFCIPINVDQWKSN